MAAAASGRTFYAMFFPASKLGMVLGGGGARSAYQVGVLRSILRRYPKLSISHITGVSAGAINAAFLANLPSRKSFSPDAAYYTGPPAGMKFLPQPPDFAAEVRSEGDYGPAAERAIAKKSGLFRRWNESRSGRRSRQRGRGPRLSVRQSGQSNDLSPRRLCRGRAPFHR